VVVDKVCAPLRRGGGADLWGALHDGVGAALDALDATARPAKGKKPAAAAAAEAQVSNLMCRVPPIGRPS
jgi:hypothetical protein